MLTRRGFTMVELLVGIVLLGIIGLATTRLLRTMLGATSAQMNIAANQGEVRTGALALPQELREIGYDTIPLAGSATTDLEAIADNRITFRAMRGMSTTCGTPSLTSFKIRKPVFGVRQPLLTDGFLLFVESDPNYGLDDQWVAMSVTNIDYSSTCGADSAIAITLAAAPQVDPGAGTAMALSQYFVGGPIRWYERLEYGPVTSSGQTYLGVRSLSLGQADLSPVIGPLPDSTGFTLQFFGANGGLLTPGVASPLSVRSIGVTITGVARGPVSLAGSAKRSRSQMSVTTRVALRNALRP